jgi:hypothetical protein
MNKTIRFKKYCTDTYVLVSINAAKQAAADRIRAEAERMAAANATPNADVPPDALAPPVVPPVVPAAALLPAAQVVIGAGALAQLLAAC